MYVCVCPIHTVAPCHDGFWSQHLVTKHPTYLLKSLTLQNANDSHAIRRYVVAVYLLNRFSCGDLHDQNILFDLSWCYICFVLFANTSIASACGAKPLSKKPPGMRSVHVWKGIPLAATMVLDPTCTHCPGGCCLFWLCGVNHLWNVLGSGTSCTWCWWTVTQ